MNQPGFNSVYSVNERLKDDKCMTYMQTTLAWAKHLPPHMDIKAMNGYTGGVKVAVHKVGNAQLLRSDLYSSDESYCCISL